MTNQNSDSNGGTKRSHLRGSVSRRWILRAAVVTGGVLGVGGYVHGQQGSREIELVGRTGGWEGAAPTDIDGETNPTLSLVAGEDYTVTWENGDGAPHNFAVRDENGENLVASDIMSEQGATQTVEFTASEEMTQYVCEVHPGSMRGGVEITTETETPPDGGEQPTASVTFEDQTTDGSSVEVASTTMSEGGFVAIHDSRLLDGDAIGSVVGVSSYLDPGSHETVRVSLDEAPDDGETLIAMPHQDTNGNESYDFVTSEGAEDGPYTDDGGAVTDDATTTLEDDGPDVDLPREYHADLQGGVQPQCVETDASGEATFEIDEDGTEASYEVTVTDITNVTQAHIHLGDEGESGPVVAWLYPEEGREPQLIEGETSGTLAEGVITEDDLVGEWEGADFEAVIATFEDGSSYVNVHTEEHPAGEIRGQITPRNE